MYRTGGWTGTEMDAQTRSWKSNKNSHCKERSSRSVSATLIHVDVLVLELLVHSVWYLLYSESKAAKKGKSGRVSAAADQLQVDPDAGPELKEALEVCTTCIFYYKIITGSFIPTS